MASKATKRAASKPAQAPAKRERSSPKDPNMEKCQAVAAALEAADESVLLKPVATLLAQVQPHTLLVPKAERHEYQEFVVNMTAETLVAIESTLDQTVQQAQAKIDGADAEKAARDAAVAAKIAELEKLEAVVREKDEALVQTSAALEEANKAMDEANVAQKAGDRAFEELRARADRITDAIDKAFLPLKERTEGLDEKPLLKSIVSIGEEHGFDTFMMTAALTALATPARSSFDNMVLSQVETMMREKLSEFKRLVDEAADVSSKHALAVDEAVANANVAAEKTAASVTALEEAKVAKTVCSEAVSALQQSLSEFLSVSKAAGDTLDEGKVTLAEFRAGVMAHFGELRDLVPAAEVNEGLSVVS